MPESINLFTMGATALTGIGMKLVFLCLALVVMTMMRKVIFGDDGVKNDWIAQAKQKGDFRSVAIYQCVMFGSTCFLLGSVLS
ncbi:MULTISPECIES: hypothetical protein [Vibrio harveyi group]|uniref:hypothetical protein n=1 Tax=Vibrio harveyi group TaxID=717610 RepID=UPI000CD338BC|nr:MULTISPECIES: hypothetical protein [Vibrio harveyi group]AUW07562.1 hypothetical protein C1N51_28490 [Vibrio campbellii]NEU19238.1 hypothetical protein [Vibrio parahaemolyticus]